MVVRLRLLCRKLPEALTIFHKRRQIFLYLSSVLTGNRPRLTLRASSLDGGANVTFAYANRLSQQDRGSRDDQLLPTLPLIPIMDNASVFQNASALIDDHRIVVYGVVTIPLLFIGILNNFIVIYLVYCVPELRAPVNLLLVSLNVTQIFETVVYYAPTVFGVLRGYDDSSNLGSIPFLSEQYSWTLYLILAVNRLIAIRFPEKYNLFSPWKSAVIGICVSISVAGLLLVIYGLLMPITGNGEGRGGVM